MWRLRSGSRAHSGKGYDEPAKAEAIKVALHQRHLAQPAAITAAYAATVQATGAAPRLPAVVVDCGLQGATVAPAMPFEIRCGFKMRYRAQA